MPKQRQHRDRVYQMIGEPGPGAMTVGYVRYSMELQEKATIVTQKRRISEYAEKKGWIVSRWYEEPAHSAKYEEIEQRPIFAQLLHDAGTQYQVVLCYMNNRWSRNVSVAYASLTQLRRKRVWWGTADGQWDIDKVQQDGFDVAFAVDTQLNAAYIRQLSKRVIDGKEDRARDGYNNGKVPFGYLMPDYPKAPDGAPSTWRPPRMPARIDPDNFPALVRIGELAAAGWSDGAIADELDGYFSNSPRFGKRLLVKDTIAALRRSWFPREFAPGSGHGTIEAPSGELIEGRHPSAWPYEIWQRIIEAKAGQFRRPSVEQQRRAHPFSRIIVCAACRRPLRVTTSPSNGTTYYKDTSSERKLPCDAYGCLSTKSDVLDVQFGELLASITLPLAWRDVITEHCAVMLHDPETDAVQSRRDTLEAEQQRLISAYTKGYVNENDLDTQMARIRSELLTLPVPIQRDLTDFTQIALEAAETLTDMASYWSEAVDEERRDIVWALLNLNGLAYDLERHAIVGIYPRSDVVPVLTIGLGSRWESRDGGLWLRAEHIPAKRAIPDNPHRGYRQPPSLTAEQELQVITLLKQGYRPRRIAKLFDVSYWAIWRLMRREMPPQSQPGPRKLSPAQASEAQTLAQQGISLRDIAKQFGVSHGAIWRMLKQKGGEVSS